ncbi:hypothetical protein CI610_01693 [invertebrate metagenome]|uniref:Transposase n=1 Tax=invertebrate metagenome TaxID=1711999 RepID=A0A2H9T7X6_9ZZZZ
MSLFLGRVTKPNKRIKDVAEDLDIHPFMLSRWRKEYIEGKLVADKRKLSKLVAGINNPKSLSEKQRIQELEAENAELKLEIDLLKKWQRFLAEEQRQGSGS